MKLLGVFQNSSAAFDQLSADCYHRSDGVQGVLPGAGPRLPRHQITCRGDANPRDRLMPILCLGLEDRAGLDERTDRFRGEELVEAMENVPVVGAGEPRHDFLDPRERTASRTSVVRKGRLAEHRDLSKKRLGVPAQVEESPGPALHAQSGESVDVLGRQVAPGDEQRGGAK